MFQSLSLIRNVSSKMAAGNILDLQTRQTATSCKPKRQLGKGLDYPTLLSILSHLALL